MLLVDEDSRLLGLISTETLFKVQNALLLANISQLEKKEREIREKNEQMESELRMAMELQQAMMPKTEPLSLRKAGWQLPALRPPLRRGRPRRRRLFSHRPAVRLRCQCLYL